MILLFSFFFLMIRRPPRSTQSRSSAASDVYKRQRPGRSWPARQSGCWERRPRLSLIHISEPTRLGMISYAVFCLKKKKNKNHHHVPRATHDSNTDNTDTSNIR